MIDITPIFTAVIAFCGVLLSGYLLPLLRQKTDAEDLKRLLSLAKMAVSAAEQLLPTSDGQGKKRYVVEFLQKYDLNVDEAQLNLAIESAVLSLHRQLEVTDETV